MYSNSSERQLEAVNAVTAKNELLPGLNTSVIRFPITELGLVDPIRRLPVRESFDFSSAREARISEFNLAMLKEAEKNSGIGLWLSPPDKVNPTGKILVAVRDGETVVEYDTTGLTFSGKDFAVFVTGLTRFYQDGYFFLPGDSWKILEEVIPMPLAWQGIRNDQAEMKFNREVEEMKQKVRGGNWEQIRMVVMEERGVDINTACPPGSRVTVKTVSPEGTIGTFAKHCGMCGREINQWLHAGDKCRFCGETYLGVCG